MLSDKKQKVFTLSYDDGVATDARFVKMINKYGIKCTFNLNSSFIGSTNQWNYNRLKVTYLDQADAQTLYEGHEIAVHTCTHPHLEELSKEEMIAEILEDKTILQKMFQQPVTGMAYPYGTYNPSVKEAAAACGISYARTVVSTHTFTPPEDFLEWHFTCHHKDSRLMELAEQFCASPATELQIFSVWGHSYEFEGDDNWTILEGLCNYLSQQNDIYFATNLEICNRIKSSIQG